MNEAGRTVQAAEPQQRDIVGDRHRLVRIGMVAVFSACVLFTGTRLGVTLSTGKLTPWWANAAGALSIALLWLWYRRSPESRSPAAAHGTALVATLALLVPVAYGMTSSIWWLSLVGFAEVLLGRRSEAWVWGITIPIVTAGAAFLEPHIQVPGGAGEPALERDLARVVFVVLLVGMAAAFRKVANHRADALARASAARGRFLAHVSHEIRTPLHGVLSMTELALHAELPAEARQQVETAHQSARVLLGLLNNVLDLTRAESDALLLDVKPFELHGALAEVLRPLAAQARGQGLAFTATAEAGLASLRRGDRYRVSQIALNLVGNALKFTREGGITVGLSSEPGERDRVVLAVEDTGPGVEPEVRDVIFQPFSQGPSARASGGAGLGMAIVQELARLMDGRVSVASEAGRGSVFTVSLRLPVEPGAHPGPADLLAEPAREAAAASLPGPGVPKLRILVCEDDPVNQKVVRAMLKRLGQESTLVATAEEAWSTLLAESFDILLTDIELPGMDGQELARKVRTRERERGLPRLPIVAATAHVGQDEKHRLLAAGIDAHLPKPFAISQVEEVLRLAVAKMRAEGRG